MFLFFVLQFAKSSALCFKKIMDSMMRRKGPIPPTEIKCHKPLRKQCLEVSVEQNVESPHKTYVVDWTNLWNNRKGLEGWMTPFSFLNWGLPSATERGVVCKVYIFMWQVTSYLSNTASILTFFFTPSPSQCRSFHQHSSLGLSFLIYKVNGLNQMVC